MIVYCAILSYLCMHTRWGCSRWGVRGRGCRMHPSSPLWHKKSSVCPPQFDAVICHASNNLGVWRLFKLLQDELNLFDTFFSSNNEILFLFSASKNFSANSNSAKVFKSQSVSFFLNSVICVACPADTRQLTSKFSALTSNGFHLVSPLLKQELTSTAAGLTTTTTVFFLLTGFHVDKGRLEDATYTA